MQQFAQTLPRGQIAHHQPAGCIHSNLGKVKVPNQTFRGLNPTFFFSAKIHPHFCKTMQFSSPRGAQLHIILFSFCPSYGKIANFLSLIHSSVFLPIISIH
jgi:hypothetical protein